MDDYSRRIIGFGIHAGVVTGSTVCRMFKHAIRDATALPKYLSSDHDPLYRFHQWKANLRILDIVEIKTVPDVPWSRPFIERLIGTVRRECLDRSLFWTTADLEAKLIEFQNYYNEHRVHRGLGGKPPDAPGTGPLNLGSYGLAETLSRVVSNADSRVILRIRHVQAAVLESWNIQD